MTCNYMTKKEFKKARVSIYSGYAYTKPIIEIRDDITNETLARIKTEDIEIFIARWVRGGLFDFTEKGRKYQYITLK